MKKIKFFSMLLVMLFGLVLSGVINANASTEYVPVAGGNMTGTAPTFTMGSEKSFVKYDITDLDLTKEKIYISIKYTSAAKNFDIHANTEGDSYQLSYKVKDNTTGNVIEYTDYNEFLIVTAEVKGRIDTLGLTEISTIYFKFRGSVGDTVTIHDFKIHYEAAHGFDTTVGGGEEDTNPDTPTTDRVKYNFSADWAMTGENNLFTLTDAKGCVISPVSGVDLTKDVYVSIMYSSETVTNFDMHAYGEGTNGSYKDIVYKMETEAGNKTEYTKTGNVVVATANVTGYLNANGSSYIGITSLDYIKITFRGAAGNVVEILDFAFTVDGNHGFEVPGQGGGSDEPEVPSIALGDFDGYDLEVNNLTADGDVYTLTDASASIVASFNNLSPEYKYVSIKYALGEGVNFETYANTYSVTDGTANLEIVAGSITGAWNASTKDYGDYKISTLDISSFLTDNLGYNKIHLSIAGAVDGTIKFMGLEITKDGAHNLVSYDSSKPTTYSEIYGGSSVSALLSQNEAGEQVITYDAATAPGWNTFKIDVENYNPELVKFRLEYSSAQTVVMCFQINGKYDGHNVYPAGENQVAIVDFSDTEKYKTGVSFTLEIYIDASGATIEGEKAITIHSYEFFEVTYDPSKPISYSEIGGSSISALLSKNEAGEQVITYGASNAPGWHTFNIQVANYNPELKEFEIVYSSATPFVMCVQINDKYEGHISYPAGQNKVAKLDFSDSKYNLGLEFTVEIFLDATETVTEEKAITIHSYGFVESEPLPEGLLISDPRGSGVNVAEGENGAWVITYSNATDSWRNATITINNHEVIYDILRVKIDLSAGTNLGIRLYYATEDGSDYVDLRSHFKPEGVASTAGEQDLVFFMAAYGLADKEVVKVELWFDAPTDYTTNTGDVTATLKSFEFLKSSDLTLGDLEFSAEDVVVDYTGEEVAVEVECAEEVAFVVEYSKVVEGEEASWSESVPTTAGQYNVRIVFKGSLVYNYKIVEASLTINKVKATVNADDVTVDGLTRVVTVKEGIEASTSAEFATGSEVVNGAIVEYGTVIYYRHAANENYNVSDVLSLTFNKPASLVLEQAKADAKAELAAYKSADLYYEAEQAELAAAIAAGNTAIIAADTEAKVAEELAKAKAAIDAIKTIVKYEEEAVAALAKAKVDAKAELAAYKSADLYREAEQAQLAAAIAAGNTAIDAAATADVVAFALTTAKAKIDALKTKAQYEAEEEAALAELAKAKSDAKAALASYKSADLYREAEQAQLAAAIAAGNTAIDAATSKNDISAALATAKASIDTIKTKAVYEAEEKQAAEALAKAKEEAIAAIVAEIGSYSIDKASYEASINAATSVEEVQSALAAAKTDIAAKKAAIDKENEKEPEQPVEPEKPKKGCKGAIVPSILSVIALLGVCFTFKRKEQE